MSKQLSHALLIAALATILIAAGLPGPQAGLAAPFRQVAVSTPTAGADGQIIYIVKANDTLLGISLMSGVPVEKIKTLNNLTSDIIVEGQRLLIGLAGPVEVTNTPGPSPTPTEILPTATPKPGSAKLCILLFNDLNGDSIRQEEEPAIASGELSITNRSGTVTKTAATQEGLDPSCFEKLPEGDYNISVAIPAGYNATTVMNYALSLKAGDETYVDFGAQANSDRLAAAPLPGGSGQSPLLALIGGALLVVGLGVALFAGRLLRTK